MPTPREQLADMLQQSRKQAGFGSHGALARKLNVSRSVVSKAENPGQPIPGERLLAAWSGATGVPLDDLQTLVRRAKSGTPDFFMPYLVEEAKAHTLRCWSPVQVPGLLQCEAYARATFAVEPYTPDRLLELVAARMERQAVLERAYVMAVIDALVLEREVGSPQIMTEQCAYLARLGEQPNIALHVIPHRVNMGLWGGFDIAMTDTATTVCLTAIEDIPTNSASLVVKTMQAFERMLGAALPKAESLNLIVEAATKRWKTQKT
jgi:transcriptional regulator with XRE-family HTH domain